uniref:Uncharacterized protein n=1 Tax=Tanacetum cinerariifolium TaxID=118510 RepID=A0A6L2LJX3_TANCI|nr:hypothetical protein [Tanacetum cinerariifolium]
MDFQNEINRLQEMLNLRNSNQDPPIDLYDLKGSDEGNNKIDSLTKEPSDTLLMGDEVISIHPTKENDEFIKSSVDDLVPIPRKLEVTSVCDDLECNMPVNTPLPTTDVREKDFDINSPLREQVVEFLMENEDVASFPRHLVKQFFSHLVKHLSSTKRMSDEPVGDDSKPRSCVVTFSNPLFNFNDDYALCNDNPLFDEEFEDISSLDSGPPESTPVIDESTLLVTSLLDPKQICLRKVEIFDLFFSLTQLGGKERVMETPYFGFYHMPSPCPAAYSPTEIPSGESKVHIEVLSVLWGKRLPISDGSLPLSSGLYDGGKGDLKWTLGESGGESFWEEGNDFGVDYLRFHTCLTDILGFIEKLKWWFEQDINDEGEENEEDGGGDEV